MRRLKVLFVPHPIEELLTPWVEDVIAAVGDRHDLRLFDRGQEAKPQLEGIEAIVDLGGNIQADLIDVAATYNSDIFTARSTYNLLDAKASANATYRGHFLYETAPLQHSFETDIEVTPTFDFPKALHHDLIAGLNYRLKKIDWNYLIDEPPIEHHVGLFAQDAMVNGEVKKVDEAAKDHHDKGFFQKLFFGTAAIVGALLLCIIGSTAAIAFLTSPITSEKGEDGQTVSFMAANDGSGTITQTLPASATLPLLAAPAPPPAAPPPAARSAHPPPLLPPPASPPAVVPSLFRWRRRRLTPLPPPATPGPPPAAAALSPPPRPAASSAPPPPPPARLSLSRRLRWRAAAHQWHLACG